MKTYRTIEKYDLDRLGQHIFAFDKIDGSNFRAEWDKKLSKKSRFTNGFKKFGTRKEVINQYNPFIEAVTIFENKYAKQLDEIFRTEKLFRKADRLTVYGEFFGKNSFAGIHEWNEIHDLKIFDIFIYKKDFVTPSDFISVMTKIDTPHLVYSGHLTLDFVQKVENNHFNLKEGVVYKGVDNKKVFMGKIKTNTWLQKVKELHGEKMLEY